MIERLSRLVQLNSKKASQVRKAGLPALLAGKNMSLPIVIVNPESAGGGTRDAWPGIASELSTHFGSFTPKFTTEAGDGIEIAANAARKGVKLIFAFGGGGANFLGGKGVFFVVGGKGVGVIPRRNG